MTYYYKKVNTSVGILTLIAGERGLRAILWENDDPKRVLLPELTEKNDYPLLEETEKQLEEYFKGERKEFTIQLDWEGTDFQKKVWNALLSIPYGETRTYSELAIALGNLKAVRAVGAANGKNPISIIAPCHRVIGASGSLTGFAGGLENKAILLKLENNNTDPSTRSGQPQLQLFGK